MNTFRRSLNGNLSTTNAHLDNKLEKTDVVNSLNITVPGKALDACQGKALDDKFGGIIKIIRASQSMTFSNGLAEYSTNINGTGVLYFAGVCGLGTNHIFACSVTNGNLIGARVAIRCVDDKSYSGSINIRLILMVA